MQNDMKKELDELFAFGQEVIGLLENEIRQKDDEMNTLQKKYTDTQYKLDKMKQSLHNLLED